MKVGFERIKSVAYPVTVEWDETKGKVKVCSGEELNNLLDQISCDADVTHPPLVLIGNEGGELTLGVGAAVSTLNHVLPSCGPPYHVCVGDDLSEDEVDFYLCGHHTPSRRRNTIPNEVARAVAREYAETGKLSESINWEEA